MPPKRRPRPSPPPSPPPRSTSPANREQNSADENDESMLDPDAETASLFNTTFSSYSCSPLHIGKQGLGQDRLVLLCHRLRDLLVGDVVRGVQIGGLESDATLGRAGALEGLEWRWVSLDILLGGKDPRLDRRESSVELGSDTAAPSGRQPRQCLYLELSYEHAHFNAILLPATATSTRSISSTKSLPWTADQSSTTGPTRNAFIRLPLLLLRMPSPLRAVIFEFLSSTFDCRVSPLRLGTKSLVYSWEHWIAESAIAGRRRARKDVTVTLGFHLEVTPQDPSTDPSDTSFQPGLKSLDVTIPAEEVIRLVEVGQKMTDDVPRNQNPSRFKVESDADRQLRRKLAGDRDEEGWAWLDQTAGSSQDPIVELPFTHALATYIDGHLALDVFHPGVRILKIACEGFAMSANKIKLFTPGHGDTGRRAAAYKIVEELVGKATGTGWSEDAVFMAQLATASG